ncbi:CNNM domain-containing protein [Thalassoroseus pseudoceratinae]|uniref:CNNM domain-containing protein n=1 Tax=Thalassoroseus pseudoceratinae TaxID=2713176 RepID=UPI00141E22ED|nr:DUF21 domain-containing protein [Thalassoroseus pseudoceratinae]
MIFSLLSIPDSLQLIIALVIFGVGLRLSAFFSGSETGFYRLSYLRISLDARTGEPASRRLLQFMQAPSTFVSTALVGNNVANYVTTLAIGMISLSLFPNQAGSMELVATLMLTPVVFIFGELLPKNLYFRAPMHFLKRDSWKLQACYYALLPVSLPLMMVARLFERFGEAEDVRTGRVLSRNRLTQAVTEGHRQGLLTELQNKLVHGLLTIADEPVQQVATAPAMVIGCAADASRAEMLKTAQQFALPAIPVHRVGDPNAWHAYVRTVDLMVTQRSVKDLLREMPRLPAKQKKLEALLQLRRLGEDLGVLVDENDQVTGLIRQRGLMEHLLRDHHPATRKIMDD